MTRMRFGVFGLLVLALAAPTACDRRQADKKPSTAPVVQRWNYTRATWPRAAWLAACGPAESDTTRFFHVRGLSWSGAPLRQHRYCDVSIPSARGDAEPTSLVVSLATYGESNPDVDAVLQLVKASVPSDIAALVDECAAVRNDGEPECRRSSRSFRLTIHRTPTELSLVLNDGVNTDEAVARGDLPDLPEGR